MTMDRRTFLTAGAAALAALPRSSRAQDAVAIGSHDLKLGDGDRDGLRFVPRSYHPETAMPMLVMLHGAGNSARGVATYTFPLAEEFGVIVVAPDSRDEATWDVLLHGFGPDIEFIGRAMSETRGRYNIDPKKIWLAGHSDGASYALSLGLGTGDTFGYVAAFSPGVMKPAEVHGKPRIFISHGLSDPIMPIDVTSRRFVPRLRGLGYDVTYREYEGRHGVTPAVVREAFEWFLK